ncbi:MAG: PAS domain S-box protein [Pirellulales bacterium]
MSDSRAIDKNQLQNEIRRRTETEAKLLESEQRYKSIVEDQTEMIVRFDQEGKITFANKAYVERRGLPMEQLLGSDVFVPIHPDYRRFALELVQSTSNQKPVVHKAVLKVLRPDNQSDWAEWEGRALFDQAGKVVGYQAIGRVVTELVRVQEALRASEKRFRSIVEDQSEMILRFDRDGTILFANSAYLRARAIKKDELLYRCAFESFESKDVSTIRDTLAMANPTHPSSSWRARAVQSNSTEMAWEDWNCRALYDEAESFVCFQAVGRDVTALVRSEIALREKNEQIRHVARLSTLGQMMAGITHEIRQPLSSISNFAFACSNALHSDRFDALKIQYWNRAIIEQVARADAIIRRLGGFAKRSGSEPEAVNVNQSIHDCLSMMEHSIGKHSISVKLDLDPQSPSVRIERIQLEQVWINLLKNACDAIQLSQSLQREISIRTQLVDHKIVVEIRDSGPGISPDSLKNLFEPFFTNKSDGMGLGLAIVRSIVDENDGDIAFENLCQGLLVRVEFDSFNPPQSSDSPSE